MQQFWTAKDSFVTRLPANISLIQIMSKLNDSQVIRQSCVGMDVDSPECQYQLDSNRFSIAARQNLTEKLAYDASIYYCTEDDCGLAYLLYGNPKFTADIVGGLFGR